MCFPYPYSKTVKNDAIASVFDIVSQKTLGDAFIRGKFGLVDKDVIADLGTPVAYLMFDVSSGNHLLAITWLMQYGGGMAALPLGLIILYSTITNETGYPAPSAERNTLLFSFLLFAAGGIIGFMISGSNTIIPAHYHGSITAITLAFMGITYSLLPKMGFKKPAGKWVQWQPVLYGVGQLIHIAGLAWSGGHGVQRKTAGAAQGLDTAEKIIGMRVVGIGAGIAIIGGIIFLVIVIKSMLADKEST